MSNSKSWREIIKNGPSKEGAADLTVDQLYDFLKDIFNRRIQENPNRSVALYRFCKGKGHVVLENMNDPFIDLCNDPECGSCRMFEEQLKAVANG